MDQFRKEVARIVNHFIILRRQDHFMAKLKGKVFEFTVQNPYSGGSYNFERRLNQMKSEKKRELLLTGEYDLRIGSYDIQGRAVTLAVRGEAYDPILRQLFNELENQITHLYPDIKVTRIYDDSL